MYSLPLLFNTVLEILVRTMKQGKEIKGIQTGKEEVKFSLVTDGIILYMGNHKAFTQKDVSTKTNSAKLTGYKIHTQKSLAFITNNNQPQKEIKKTIPLKIASKRVKYLGISLNKKEDLHSENYKTLLKETEDRVKVKILCIHGLEYLKVSRSPHY